VEPEARVPLVTTAPRTPEPPSPFTEAERMFPIMTETSKQPAVDVDAAEMRFEEEVELSFSPIPSFEAGKT
jgi:hypothetical protein